MNTYYNRKKEIKIVKNNLKYNSSIREFARKNQFEDGNILGVLNTNVNPMLIKSINGTVELARLFLNINPVPKIEYCETLTRTDGELIGAFFNVKNYTVYFNTNFCIGSNAAVLCLREMRHVWQYQNTKEEYYESSFMNTVGCIDDTAEVDADAFAILIMKWLDGFSDIEFKKLLNEFDKIDNGARNTRYRELEKEYSERLTEFRSKVITEKIY